MLRSFLAWMAGVALALPLQAQLVLEPCPIMEMADAHSLVRPEIRLIHLDTDTVELYWVREVNDLPDDWESAVMDPNLDWAPFADMPLTFGDDTLFFSLHGQDTLTHSDHFGVLFFTAESGTGTVVFTVCERGDTTTCTTCELQVTVMPSGVDDPALAEALIFPNPVRDRLQLQLDRPWEHLSILSADGRIWKEEQGIMPGSQTWSMNELPAGWYVLQLHDRDARLHRSRRFLKVD